LDLVLVEKEKWILPTHPPTEAGIINPSIVENDRYGAGVDPPFYRPINFIQSMSNGTTFRIGACTLKFLDESSAPFNEWRESRFISF
jgi:hypothetical protein